MEKTPTLIDKIAFWDLDGDTKETIAQAMIDDVSTTVEYWSQMLLSALIATLGLLVNATPVVIWAMLIAPIMRPIQWVSFAIATWNKKLFTRSLSLLVLSILAGIGIAILCTRLIPLTEVTEEIAMRTQPTLVDLWIAFASGLVAFLALWYRKMVAWLAWVAMAASLVPPLWVIGIWIAFGSWSIWRWSSLLFLTNLVAIIVWWIIIFYLFGFYPNQKDDLKRSFMNTWFVVGMLLLLWIPLTSSLVNITKSINSQKKIYSITESFFEEIDERISIESLDIDTLWKTRDLSLNLKVPQEIIDKITDESKQMLTQDLARSLEKDVELDVTLTPITSVTAKQAKELSPEEKLRNHIKYYLQVITKDTVNLLNTDYYTDEKRFAQLTLYTEQKMNDKTWFKNKLFDYLQDQEDLIDILSIQRQENRTEPEKVREQKDDDLDTIKSSFDSFFTKSTQINNIDLIYIQGEKNNLRGKILVALNITTTEDKNSFNQKMTERKQSLQEEFSMQVSIEVVVEYLESLSF